MKLRISDQARDFGLVSSYGKLRSDQNGIQQQISSGNRIEHASDDPSGFDSLQHAAQEHLRLTQNLENIGQARDFTTATDSALQNISDQLQRASELATSAGDGTKSASDRAAIATELDSILSGVIASASQSFQGRSLFAGTETGKAAFVAVKDASGKTTGVVYQGNGDALSTEDYPGSVTPYNLAGSDEAGGAFGVFKNSANGVDVFQALVNLRDDVTGNPAAVSADMQKLNDGLEHLSLARAKIGGTQNKLTDSESLIQDMSDGLDKKISSLSQTDLADSITKLKDLEVAYQAALAVGAKVGDLSLLNYLR